VAGFDGGCDEQEFFFFFFLAVVEFNVVSSITGCSIFQTTSSTAPIWGFSHWFSSELWLIGIRVFARYPSLHIVVMMDCG
jgi:hypothetical protein